MLKPVEKCHWFDLIKHTFGSDIQILSTLSETAHTVGEKRFMHTMHGLYKESFDW